MFRLLFAIILGGVFLSGCARHPQSPAKPLSCVIEPTFKASAAGLNNFLDRWQDKVFSHLYYIYNHPVRSDRDRFLILSAGAQKYVQCHFHDNDRNIYCEAASGFYSPSYAPDFFKKDIDILADEGFSTANSKGNYSFDIQITGEETLRKVSSRMLTALYKAYAPLDPDLKICSPYMPDQ